MAGAVPNVTLPIPKGVTYKKRFVWKDVNLSPVNLSGFTARMHIRENINDAVAVIELTTENGGITLGGAAGTIDLRIESAVTEALTIDTGVYDFEIIDGSGDVDRLFEGDIETSPEVTRQ